MKKKIFIGLLVSILYCNSIYANSPIALNAYRSAVHLKKIQVKEEKIKDDSEIIEIDLKIPQITGMANNALESKLNRTFRNKIISFSNNLKEMAKEYKEAAQEYDFTTYPYQVSTHYQIYYNKNNILSLTITYYEYTGGAHGNYLRESFNINLLTGKEFSLDDLLGTDSDYQKIINNRIKNEIREHQDLYFPNNTINLDFLSKDSNFYIHNNKLVIYFQTYEIAPYSTGIPEFKIPLKLFKL